MSGARIGVDNVGRMEGLYKEGKSGRACSRRQETELTISRLVKQLTARALINVGTENGPGLLVINANPNGTACVLLLKRNLYVNSGCHLEAGTISLCITYFVARSLYLDTAVMKVGALLHSVMSGYCCHQVGCIATFCHVWILLS